MNSNLIINGTTYGSAARAAAGIALNGLDRSLEGYDVLTFSVRGGSPTLDFARNSTVQLNVQYASEGYNVKFKGIITGAEWQPGALGWTKAFSCDGLRYLADRVPITASDGTGTAVFNRQPSDIYYIADDAGLSVGTIVTRVLTNVTTATALDGLGVGGYTTLSPPTLPASTTADLALLTVVPPSPVHVSGAAILNQLSQLIARWHPKYALELQPDGVIRVKDTTSTSVFVPVTVTLPSASHVGDTGARLPTIRSSIKNCATRVVIRGGPNVGVAYLSQVDGTLSPAWSNADQTSWKYTDFSEPKTASDYGTVTANTSTSATLQSHDATRTWASNFWSTNKAKLYLVSSVTAGITGIEDRDVTSNAALTAGSTAVVNWDSSNPVTATTFDKYRIVGQAGGLSDVGRLYHVVELANGHTDLNSTVGANLVSYYPREIKWSNNSTSLGIYAPLGMVVDSNGVETIWTVEPVISTGQFRFRMPVVACFGSISWLTTNGWPASSSNGLPSDVRILALYSKGALSTASPADVGGMAQYSGTANSLDGLEVTYYIDQPGWLLNTDTTSMTTLAAEHLACQQNVIYEGNGGFYGQPTWDFLDFGTSLNYDPGVPGHEWLSMNAAIRSVSLRWNELTGALFGVSFGFSNARRPFTGDDLYLHPQFRSGSVLDNVGNLSGMNAAAGHYGAMIGGMGAAALGGALSGQAMSGIGAGAQGAMADVAGSATGAMAGMASGAYAGMSQFDSSPSIDASAMNAALTWGLTPGQGTRNVDASDINRRAVPLQATGQGQSVPQGPKWGVPPSDEAINAQRHQEATQRAIAALGGAEGESGDIANPEFED